MKTFLEKWEETTFKKNVCNEFNLFKRHYDERMFYQKVNEANKILYNGLEVNTQLAIDYLKKEDYQNATRLFLKVVNDAIALSLANSPKLATACYNYGRCLYRQGSESHKAEFFLAKASNLIKAYPSKDPHKKQIDEAKVMQALKECGEKLSSRMTAMPTLQDNAYTNVFSPSVLPSTSTVTEIQVSTTATTNTATTSDTTLKPQ